MRLMTARLVTAALLAAAVMLMTGSDAGAQMARVAPAAANLDAEALNQATALLTQLVAEQTIAGAVAAVARNGKLAYLEAVGVQDLATRAPMTERTLFRIYSMTKPVTAVAVMMLHEDGKFRLDDPVQKYLPEFGEVKVGAADAARAPSRPITVEDLLLHTSGLSHRTSELYREQRVRSRADTLPQFITKITRAPLMEDPGTRFRYSEATTVLGRLVEIWSGQPFDRFLETRVLTPLKMTDTRFWAAPDARARLATVYGPPDPGGLRPVDIEEVPFTERPQLHRRRGRARVHRPGLPSFQPDAVEPGRARGRAAARRPRPCSGWSGTGWLPRFCRRAAARWDGGSAT